MDTEYDGDHDMRIEYMHRQPNPNKSELCVVAELGVVEEAVLLPMLHTNTEFSALPVCSLFVPLTFYFPLL